MSGNPIVACEVCERRMPNNAIGRHVLAHDAGRQEARRVAKNDRQRAYNQTEAGKATKARRIRSEVGREGFTRRRRRWRTEGHGRAAYQAHNAVQRAVQSGRLVRRPCEVCADPRSFAHHHMGYAVEHRLVVTWLCLAHHMEAHGRVAA